MDHGVASRILGAARVEDLRAQGSGVSGEQLREASKALGVDLQTDKDLRSAKDRLLGAMSAAAELVGLGSKGAYVRGGDFHGSADEGVLGAQSLAEIVNPERPHMPGSRWTLERSASGALAPKGSNAAVSARGLVAFGQGRVAAIAVGKVEAALGGFEPVWEALGECAANQRRLGGLGGVDCWSKEEMSARMEEALDGRLARLPIGPESEDFPRGPGEADLGGKLAARRSAVAEPGPRVQGPRGPAAG